ncbi:MAG: PIN domain-containing protein [Myxococcales bacterium]|nr:PIN domain-containing protein [Myxococcales bacterium]
MIAIDTNVLLYAHRADSPWHAVARARIREASRRPWAIPWPCVHEFIAIATHPRVFDPPSSLSDARRAVEGWVASPKLALLAETTGYWSTLDAVLRDGKVVGPRVHDARIAALCLEHAVSELWTADRDFSRFSKLRTRNPLIG